MYKALAIIVSIIMLVSAWYLLASVYDFNITNIALDSIQKFPLGAHIVQNISQQSFLGIFYLFIILSLVFIPGPLELTYLVILSTGSSKTITLIAAVLGILIGQMINYGLGRIVSKHWKPEHTMKEKIDKYGGWFIFIASVTPFLPSQLFNFTAGTVKLSFKKWCISIAIGVVLYFSVLTLAADKIIAYVLS